MIEEIVSLQMPVEERLVIKKNRLLPSVTDKSTKRISIVTGTHGDELNGQYVCYKLIEKIKAEIPMNEYIEKMIEFIQTSKRGVLLKSHKKGHECLSDED